MDDPRITDVWFRSALTLDEIARQLELRDVSLDYENHWEWVIGSLDGVALDVTRTHTEPAADTDTNIFILAREPPKPSFGAELLDELIGRLRRFVDGPIWCGRWMYVRGQEFDRVVVRSYAT